MDDMRFQVEIAQSANSGHDTGERDRNRRRRNVREVLFPVDLEIVNLGLENTLDLGGGSAEDDKVAGAGDLANAEALGLEPGGELLNVVGAEAEAIGILLGREPLVVLRRTGILLLRQKLSDGLLLTRARHGEQRDVVELERRVDSALIVLRLSLQRTARRNLDELTRDDGAGDAVRRRGEAESREDQGAEDERRKIGQGQQGRSRSSHGHSVAQQDCQGLGSIITYAFSLS